MLLSTCDKGVRYVWQKEERDSVRVMVKVLNYVDSTGTLEVFRRACFCLVFSPLHSDLGRGRCPRY